MGTDASFFGGGIKRSERENDSSLQSNSDIKDKCNRISTYRVFLRGMCKVTFTFTRNDLLEQDKQYRGTRDLWRSHGRNTYKIRCRISLDTYDKRQEYINGQLREILRFSVAQSVCRLGCGTDNKIRIAISGREQIFCLHKETHVGCWAGGGGC